MSDSQATAREAGIAKMKAFAARQPTLTLCAALAALDGCKLSDEERLSRAVVMDVLCERHPQAEAAAEAWAQDESTTPPRGLADVIIEAASNAVTAAKAGA